MGTGRLKYLFHWSPKICQSYNPLLPFMSLLIPLVQKPGYAADHRQFYGYQ